MSWRTTQRKMIVRRAAPSTLTTHGNTYAWKQALLLAAAAAGGSLRCAFFATSPLCREGPVGEPAPTAGWSGHQRLPRQVVRGAGEAGWHAPTWRGYIFSGSSLFKIKATLPILYLEAARKERIRWIETGAAGFGTDARLA